MLFNSLPDSARSDNVVGALGGTVFADSKRIIEVCGSPGEILLDNFPVTHLEALTRTRIVHHR